MPKVRCAHLSICSTEQSQFSLLQSGLQVIAVRFVKGARCKDEVARPRFRATQAYHSPRPRSSQTAPVGAALSRGLCPCGNLGRPVHAANSLYYPYATDLVFFQLIFKKDFSRRGGHRLSNPKNIFGSEAQQSKRNSMPSVSLQSVTFRNRSATPCSVEPQQLT